MSCIEYPQATHLRGLHGPADPGLWPWDDEAYSIIAESKTEAVKVLAASDIDDTVITRLKQVGTKQIVARIFNTVDPGSPKSGTQYVQEVLDAILRLYSSGVRYFEIANEVNLYSTAYPEGFGVSWNNGKEFSDWWIEAANYLQPIVPEAKLGFPAMSPGPAIPNLRADPINFMDMALPAIYKADWLAMHTYWGWENFGGNSWQESVEDVWEFAAKYPTKQIMITEFGNPSDAPKEIKALEYVNFYKTKMPENVGSLFCYCLSASESFASETWKGSAIPAIVGANV